jgi:hypothetical protein
VQTRVRHHTGHNAFRGLLIDIAKNRYQLLFMPIQSIKTPAIGYSFCQTYQPKQRYCSVLQYISAVWWLFIRLAEIVKKALAQKVSLPIMRIH